MPIARSAPLTGHVLAALAQTVFGVLVVLAIALALGYRGGASVAGWVGAAGMIVLMGWAVTWLCVALGLASGSVEAASNAPMPLILLPFLSSALRADRLDADRTGLGRGAPALHPDHRDAPRLPRGARPGLRRLVGDRLVRPDHRALLLVGRSALRAGSGSLIAMLTISQLAAYAGVTVRAVRHYHQVGLMPEPARDGSGYRVYDAADVVRLIRIRTLAEAGVPLARVQELLDATPEEFGEAVAQIDAELRAKIRELQEHRRRIARLAAGDTLAVPSEVVAVPRQAARQRSVGGDGRG